MRTHLTWKARVTLLAAMLAAVSIPSALHAQVAITSAQVSVPFAFACGTQHYPAGNYTLRVTNQYFAQIQGDSRSGLALTDRVQDLQPARTAKAVFRRYNGQYFLEELWSPGMTSHLNYIKSKHQKKVDLVLNTSVPSQVELALLGTLR